MLLFVGCCFIVCRLFVVGCWSFSDGYCLLSVVYWSVSCRVFFFGDLHVCQQLSCGCLMVISFVYVIIGVSVSELIGADLFVSWLLLAGLSC